MPSKKSNTIGFLTSDFVQNLIEGDRTTLAKAITLTESTRPKDRENSRLLIQKLLPETGKTHRIGITGVPGVGKSTLIDQLGTNLTDLGKKVAVLSIDPTSNVSGGSILGDKTRMSKLTANPDAYIRPSPTSGTLGGVGSNTREAMLVCEAAGFDVILIETVGTGQSEISVAEMVDFFLVLVLSGAGDELQGIKKGVLEIADMIAVNKADGDGKLSAESAASDLRTALNILPAKSTLWTPPVLTVSGLSNLGLEALWEKIESHRKIMIEHGEFETRRSNQQVSWMWSMLNSRLMEQLTEHSTISEQLPSIEKDVKDGRLAPSVAVDKILKILHDK